VQSRNRTLIHGQAAARSHHPAVPGSERRGSRGMHLRASARHPVQTLPSLPAPVPRTKGPLHRRCRRVAPGCRPEPARALLTCALRSGPVPLCLAGVSRPGPAPRAVGSSGGWGMPMGCPGPAGSQPPAPSASAAARTPPASTRGTPPRAPEGPIARWGRGTPNPPALRVAGASGPQARPAARGACSERAAAQSFPATRSRDCRLGGTAPGSAGQPAAFRARQQPDHIGSLSRPRTLH
jgi:hypothetical protein